MAGSAVTKLLAIKSLSVKELFPFEIKGDNGEVALTLYFSRPSVEDVINSKDFTGPDYEKVSDAILSIVRSARDANNKKVFGIEDIAALQNELPAALITEIYRFSQNPSRLPSGMELKKESGATS
jgi:hypothetical protein